MRWDWAKPGIYFWMKGTMVNICRLPSIGRIKTLMIAGGALNAALSGSGACVFALAPSPAAAESIAATVRSEFADVFVTRTHQSVKASMPFFGGTNIL